MGKIINFKAGPQEPSEMFHRKPEYGTKVEPITSNYDKKLQALSEQIINCQKLIEDFKQRLLEAESAGEDKIVQALRIKLTETIKEKVELIAARVELQQAQARKKPLPKNPPAA